MSGWEAYLHNILQQSPECRFVVFAARDSGEPLAKYENGLPSEITQLELKTICDIIGSRDLESEFPRYGIDIGGEHYNFQRYEDGFDTARGIKDSIKLVICATKYCIVAAAGEDPRFISTVLETVEFIRNNF